MNKETLGQVLKRYRQDDNIKIEKVERDTQISQRMILALENDDYAALPDDMYARHLIKSYAKYLSLDYNKLLNLYEQGKSGLPKKEAKKTVKVRQYITPQMVRAGIIIFIISILLFYFALQIRTVFLPPQLFVIHPEHNMKIIDNFIEVKGLTEKEARVFINEKEVFLDPDGNFQATIDLQKGVNYIKISAMKKHSRESVVYREVLVE